MWTAKRRVMEWITPFCFCIILDQTQFDEFLHSEMWYLKSKSESNHSVSMKYWIPSHTEIRKDTISCNNKSASKGSSYVFPDASLMPCWKQRDNQAKGKRTNTEITETQVKHRVNDHREVVFNQRQCPTVELEMKVNSQGMQCLGIHGNLTFKLHSGDDDKSSKVR